MDERYAMLRMAGTVFTVLAWVILGLASVAALVGIIMILLLKPAGYLVLLSSVGVGLFYCPIFFFLSGMTQVIVDMEEELRQLIEHCRPPKEG